MVNRIGKGRRKRTPEFMNLGDKVYPLNRLARKIILKSGYFVGAFGILSFGIIGRILQANGSDWNVVAATIYIVLVVALSFYLIFKKGV